MREAKTRLFEKLKNNFNHTHGIIDGIQGEPKEACLT